jgi:hypothetical protein
MELPIAISLPTPPPSEGPSAMNPDVALGTEERENGTHEVNQTGMSEVPVAEALENQDAMDIVQDEIDETNDRIEKIHNNTGVGFDKEEREYLQFRQNMIREEQKEFKAKVCVEYCH